ncbi:TniQ protein [Bacillus sp. OV166]|uniref:TniQ family protein n=1 Tax=Bacillus sp. OV166 TaxID=1882763 RepID=UPI000A2AB031|nr:TniQ family protein [Bacillus sp. OV166]SMQ80263.1 TniQ protein [Bacillus sp. OV166]
MINIKDAKINLNNKIPPRTKLFNLEPIGIGTPMVESLESYLARLALHHCITTGDLVKYIICNEMNIESNVLFENTSFIKKFGEKTDNLISALENLTSRKDLKLLTLSKWESAFVNHNGTFHEFSRWCPNCYEELKLNNNEIYEPLIWSLKCIKICPKHKMPLSSICPHCEKAPYSFSGKSIPGYCSRCNMWLGFESKSPQLDSTELEWYLFIVDEIGDLLSNKSLIEKSVSYEIISKSIAKIIGITTYGNAKDFGEMINRSRRNVGHWRSGKAQPEMESLLAICRVAKIKLMDLLQNRLDFNLINYVWESTEDILKVPKDPYRSISKKFDFNLLEKKLEEIYLTEYPPPPVKELQRRFNYNNIYRKFPLLSKRITQKYRDYQKTQKEINLNLRCEEVKRIMKELYDRLEYPSVSKVRELMKNPVSFRDPIIRATYKETLVELKIDEKEPFINNH